MPSTAPNYSSLNPVSAGRAPGLGRLAGKRVLVVAGGQRKLEGEDASAPPGNGRAMCIVFGREGAAVAVHNRTVEGAEATAELVRMEDACPLAVALGGDVTVEEDVKRVVAEAVEKLGGPLDGLVANVGASIGAAGLSLSVEDLEATMRLNFISQFSFLKHAAPHLRPGASVVLVSSVGAAQPTGAIQYDSSKTALDGLLRSAGSQLAAQGTRVNVLRIGIADTPMGRAANRVAPARMGVSIPLQNRLGTPWEQAYYALFLLSDDSAYVTGQIHACDGGVTTLRNIYSH
ncbi:short-chain alcohol dehydrogenase like protein [Hyaloraphidium curvatum]|nr:short-chain alcohol dehydrogenase like protein [Hyaloraphidium curvatum]